MILNHRLGTRALLQSLPAAFPTLALLMLTDTPWNSALLLCFWIIPCHLSRKAFSLPNLLWMDSPYENFIMLTVFKPLFYPGDSGLSLRLTLPRTTTLYLAVPVTETISHACPQFQERKNVFFLILIAEVVPCFSKVIFYSQFYDLKRIFFTLDRICSL